jgi:hypothetical protein
VASKLACVGLSVEDDDQFGRLLERVQADATTIGTHGGVDVWRWEDPSGARLVIGVDGDGNVLDLVPSFAAPRAVRVVGLAPVNDAVSMADVIDDAGEMTTRLAVEIEERRLLTPPYEEPLAATLVALAVDASVFADAAAFAADDASLLTPTTAQEPRPANLPRDFPWPPRIGPESFISYGSFQGTDAAAHAKIACTVVAAGRRTNQLTGQSFVVAWGASVFELTVCLSADHEVPRPGSVIAGTAYMVGSVAPPT